MGAVRGEGLGVNEADDGGKQPRRRRGRASSSGRRSVAIAGLGIGWLGIDGLGGHQKEGNRTGRHGEERGGSDKRRECRESRAIGKGPPRSRRSPATHCSG